MTTVTLYVKPGCINNKRQHRLLEAAGHEVIVRDLLNQAWTPELLKPFFTGLPVGQWFNATAPRVKSGEVRPGELDADQALALMVQEPLLIRRPLIEVHGEKMVGFEPGKLQALIGLQPPPDEDLETCAQNR